MATLFGKMMSKRMGVPYSQTSSHFRGGILRIFHVRIGHIFVEIWGFLMMFLQKQRLHGGYSGYMAMIQVIFWCSERPPIHHKKWQDFVLR